MISVNYDPIYGHAIADGHVERQVEEWLRNDFVTVEVSTENVIHQLRLQVKMHRLMPEDLQIWYKDKMIRVDREGNLERWPDGFCDTITNITESLIDWDKA